MIEITKIGEHTIHDSSFQVNRPNGHSVYLLLLVKSPAYFWVDNQFISVLPDTMFLFQPGQQHLYHAAEEAYIDSWAHIKSTHPIFETYFPYGKPILLPNPEIYHNLFHLICNEFYETNPHRTTTIHYLNTAFFQKINDALSSSESLTSHYELVQLRTEIYSNPAKDWNIKKIAESLHISVGYFHSLYKKMFHTTCTKDVIQSRMEYAADLLISTDKSINEIAEISGYRYTEHFLRQFKSFTKDTPLQYRKKYSLSYLQNF